MNIKSVRCLNDEGCRDRLTFRSLHPTNLLISYLFVFCNDSGYDMLKME